MHDSRTCEHASVVSLLLGAMLICSPLVAARAEEKASDGTSGMGELRIEGRAIERLVLADSNDNQKEFDRPGAAVTLPEGEYRLREVALEGGYHCWPHQVPEGSRVVVSGDRPAMLKVGAPLSQRVKPERRGSSLVLNFEVVGGAGERYSPPTSTSKPHVVVYRHDKPILSTDFEYG
jgi:hypothetical protein